MKRSNILNLGSNLLIFTAGVLLLTGITAYLICTYEELISAALL